MDKLSWKQIANVSNAYSHSNLSRIEKITLSQICIIRPFLQLFNSTKIMPDIVISELCDLRVYVLDAVTCTGWTANLWTVSVQCFTQVMNGSNWLFATLTCIFNSNSYKCRPLLIRKRSAVGSTCDLLLIGSVHFTSYASPYIRRYWRLSKRQEGGKKRRKKWQPQRTASEALADQRPPWDSWDRPSLLTC